MKTKKVKKALLVTVLFLAVLSLTLSPAAQAGRSRLEDLMKRYKSCIGSGCLGLLGMTFDCLYRGLEHVILQCAEEQGVSVEVIWGPGGEELREEWIEVIDLLQNEELAPDIPLTSSSELMRELVHRRHIVDLDDGKGTDIVRHPRLREIPEKVREKFTYRGKTYGIPTVKVEDPENKEDTGTMPS